jgi:two-component system response regulator FixJ
MSETILIVDDDNDVRDSLKALLESAGYAVRDFASPGEILGYDGLKSSACLVADIRMPGMDGLALQDEIRKRGIAIPVIFVTGHGDVPLAVRAMKAGAIDFVEKPFDDELLLRGIEKAVALGSQVRDDVAAAAAARHKIERLTPREREVLEHLVLGRPNKVIAYEMDISPRTVEIHRAHLMEKMEAKSLSDLVRTALAAGLAPQAG